MRKRGMSARSPDVQMTMGPWLWKKKEREGEMGERAARDGDIAWGEGTVWQGQQSSAVLASPLPPPGTQEDYICQAPWKLCARTLTNEMWGEVMYAASRPGFANTRWDLPGFPWQLQGWHDHKHSFQMAQEQDSRSQVPKDPCLDPDVDTWT